MQRYIVVRFLQALLTLGVLSVVIFSLVRLTGSPVDMLLPMEHSQEDRVEMERYLGLDKPVLVQYGIYISRLARGDFGESIHQKRPVLELIKNRLPNSIKLAAFAMGITLLLAFPLAVVAAVKKGSMLDSLARLVAVLGQSLPGFWVGLVLMELVAVRAGVLPVQGMGGIGHYILPGFTMGWHVCAGVMRLLRSSLLDVLDSEYVKLARIKGLSEWVVIWKHALRNALISVVTFSGMYFSILISSAIIVETVFVWPGVGRLAYEGILYRDFPVVEGTVLIAAVMTVTINLIVDILYAYINPRIRYGTSGK